MSLFCFFFSFLSVCKNQKSELQVRPPPLCTLAHLFKGLFMWDFPLSMRISWTFDSLPGKLNVFFSAFSAAGFSQSLLFLLLRKKKRRIAVERRAKATPWAWPHHPCGGAGGLGVYILPPSGRRKQLSEVAALLFFLPPSKMQKCVWKELRRKPLERSTVSEWPWFPEWRHWRHFVQISFQDGIDNKR